MRHICVFAGSSPGIRPAYQEAARALGNEGFIQPLHGRLLLCKDTPVELLDSFAAFRPPAEQSKWTELPPER
jgi:predicted Rossmann-fold nucleotide-binding protein